MRKQAELLFRRPLGQWIKKTPREVFIVGSLLIVYLIHNVIVLTQMLLEL